MDANLGLVALIVVLVALLLKVLLVFGDYYSGGEGGRRCVKSVIGLWAQGTHRKLRLNEFRVELLFETPVIFLAHPENKIGPVPGRDIYYIDGTDESYKNTRVVPPAVQIEADIQAAAQAFGGVDERASWVILLSALQLEEKVSRQWDENIRTKKPPGKGMIRAPQYEHAVALQSKTRSWDLMPAITKPYSTTGICHLVEMVAMLGMYWKAFVQDKYFRAEGNGFTLTSTNVPDLGIIVIFVATGRSRFLENRVIPCEAIKELPFGYVPSIFDDQDYLQGQETAQPISLVFGSTEDVTNTLQYLGCCSDTLRRFRRDHTHIFSVSFEIIGMLGKAFRIRGSSFRMLPNPTWDHWPKNINRGTQSWKIKSLMDVFQDRIRKHCSTEIYDYGDLICQIPDKWEAVERLWIKPLEEKHLNIEAREAIHDVLDETTEYLLSLKQSDVLNVLVAHLSKVMEFLDDPNSQLKSLNSAIPANKEELLINYYFDHIRPEVINKLDANGQPLTRVAMEQRNTIWIHLLFRMLCWFLLHDFDQQDVKIVPSDLRGSRMPVYIG